MGTRPAQSVRVLLPGTVPSGAWEQGSGTVHRSHRRPALKSGWLGAGHPMQNNRQPTFRIKWQVFYTESGNGGQEGRIMLGEGLACSCSESLSGLAELGLQDRAWPACRAATSSIQQVPSAPGGDVGRAGGGEPDSLPPSQRSLGRPRLSPTHFRSRSQDRQQSPCF